MSSPRPYSLAQRRNKPFYAINDILTLMALTVCPLWKQCYRREDLDTMITQTRTRISVPLHGRIVIFFFEMKKKEELKYYWWINSIWIKNPGSSNQEKVRSPSIVDTVRMPIGKRNQSWLHYTVHMFQPGRANSLPIYWNRTHLVIMKPFKVPTL